MGLRSKIGWIVHGHDNTMRTLDALSVDVRELQQKVDSLARAVAHNDQELREQQVVEFDRVRDAVIRATDDLSARIAALRDAGDDSDADRRTLGGAVTAPDAGDVAVSVSATGSSEPAVVGSGAADTPEARLTRWIARDAEIGLAAQRDELRRRLAEREREVADLRERVAHLSNAVGQLRSQPAGPAGPAGLGGRVSRTLRRTASRVLRR